MTIAESALELITNVILINMSNHKTKIVVHLCLTNLRTKIKKTDWMKCLQWNTYNCLCNLCPEWNHMADFTALFHMSVLFVALQPRAAFVNQTKLYERVHFFLFIVIYYAWPIFSANIAKRLTESLNMGCRKASICNILKDI